MNAKKMGSCLKFIYSNYTSITYFFAEDGLHSIFCCTTEVSVDYRKYDY